MPNVGRDIGPLFTAFREQILAGYDVFGHLHTKRSLVLGDPRIGENWRNFCREHLLGAAASHDGPDPAVVRGRSETWPRVPQRSAHLAGRRHNERWSVWHAALVSTPPFRSSCSTRSGRCSGRERAALAPLFELGLGWEDYPPEPLPYDGTILHAIERLVTLVAQHRGFTVAATHVPGIGR